MSFQELLYELSTDRLREIVRRRARTFRGIPHITDKRELVRFLASALNNYESALKAIHSTTLPEMQTLLTIVSRGGEVPVEELTVAAGAGKSERLEEILDSLESTGLAFRNRRPLIWSIYVPTGVRQAAPLPAPLRHRLADWLPLQLREALVRIHESLGLPYSAALNKYDLTQQIVKEVTSGGRAGEILAGLSAEAREIMDILLRHGGVVSQHSLITQLDARKRGQLMTGGWTQHWHVSKPRNGVEELLSNGLVIVQASTGWGAWDVIAPGDVLEPLLGRSLIGPLIPDEPIPQLVKDDDMRPSSHSSILRDAVYLLAYIAKNEAPATAAGNMHRSSIKALSKSLSIPDPQYAEFVYCLVRDAGLITPHGRKGLYTLTSRGRSWLDDSEETQIKSLYDAWMSRGSWDERAVDPMWDGKTFRSIAEILDVREPLIQILRSHALSQPNALLAMSSIVEIARYRWWARFCFEVQVRQPEEGEESAEGPYGFVGSNLRLVRAVTAGSLYRLGLTELYRDPSQQEFVRLTPLGRRVVLNETRDQPASERPRFVVQPNLEVYAPPGLPAGDLYRLFRMAEPAGAGLLAISRESLRKAFDSGERSDELIAFLRERSVSGLPQNVEYLIREVGAKHGHIRIGQAGLFIQVSDPLLMKELQSQKGLKVHFREELSETIALISGDSIDAVMKQLRQAGYMPVTSAGESAGTQKPPAAPALAPPPRISSSEKEARIDWESVAATEDRPWTVDESAVSSAAPKNNGNGIRALVKQAIREGRCLEISYHKRGDDFDTLRVVEPEFMDEYQLHAYCRLRGDDRVFNFSNITAARLLDEVFAGDD